MCQHLAIFTPAKGSSALATNKKIFAISGKILIVLGTETLSPSIQIAVLMGGLLITLLGSLADL